MELIQYNFSITNDTSLPFTSDNGDGNLLVVLVTFNAGQPTDTYTVDDTNNNVYQTLGKRIFPNPAIGGNSQLFYAFNSVAGPNTVSWHASVPSTVIGFVIHEFSLVNALDVHAVATGSGASQDSGPITTNFANALLFGYEAGINQNSATSGVGWTSVEIPNVSTQCRTQYQVVSSIGTYNSTTTTTSGKSQTNHWVEEILAFYEAVPVPRSTIIEF